MVKAQSLSYDDVFNALKNGDFYSSNKPLIHELSIEDGVVNIKCSDARKVYLTTERRYTKFMIAKDNEVINEVSFDMNDYLNRVNYDVTKHYYIRVTVEDKEGNKAVSRAYFLDELINK